MVKHSFFVSDMLLYKIQTHFLLSWEKILNDTAADKYFYKG